MRHSFGIAVVVLFNLSGATLPAQRGPGEAPAAGPEAARCRALANFVVPDLPDASTRIQSARLVDVPAGGLPAPSFGPPVSGSAPIQTTIKQVPVR